MLSCHYLRLFDSYAPATEHLGAGLFVGWSGPVGDKFQKKFGHISWATVQNFGKEISTQAAHEPYVHSSV